MKKLFTLTTIVFLSSVSILSAQSDGDIFERFPWLISNNIVDPSNCSSETIEVYQQSIFNFLLVTDASGTSTLYNQEGLFYCQNAFNYDCVEAFGFDPPVETYRCGDAGNGGNGSCGDVSGTIFFAPCDNQLFFLVRLDDGRVLDPYIDQVPTYVPVEGQTINFNFTNAPFGTPCINAERAINLSCVDIVDTPEVSADCSNNTGTIFFEQCDGVSFYFIRTSNGVVLDAYQAPGVNFQPAEGQTVNFDFYDATFETPCSQADRAVIITCIELATPSAPTVFEDFAFVQDLVDPADCAGTSIEVYKQGPFSFIFINTGTESGQLYFEDGTFYCNTMTNYDCVSLYNLGAPSSVWNCGDPGIVSTETRSAVDIGKPAFTAYPNPTTGFVTIQLETENESAQHMFVTDALGRTALQKDIAPRVTSTTLDISSYQKGLYYVVVQAGDQRVVKKVIKQ